MSAEIPAEFEHQRCDELSKQSRDPALQGLTREWFNASTRNNYCYHFDWLSRPIIQYPPDIVAMQEIIWKVKPDLIVECGIAYGGSLILGASMLALLDYRAAVEKGTALDPKQSHSRVLGVDIDVRSHNRVAIEAHFLSHKIRLIEGNSIAPETVAQVKGFAKGFKNILVVLDSNHTHEHVSAELEAYAELTTVGSYCAVFDTVIEDMPAAIHDNRKWGPGNNPKTAVWDFLKTHADFEIDTEIDSKLLISAAPQGFLKRTLRSR